MARFWQLTPGVQRDILHQYWRYRPTGQLWAVKYVDGGLRAACGPLDPAEMSLSILPFLPFDFRDVAWLQDQTRNFVLERLGA